MSNSYRLPDSSTQPYTDAFAARENGLGVPLSDQGRAPDTRVQLGQFVAFVIAFHQRSYMSWITVYIAVGMLSMTPPSTCLHVPHGEPQIGKRYRKALLPLRLGCLFPHRKNHVSCCPFSLTTYSREFKHLRKDSVFTFKCFKQRGSQMAVFVVI